MLVIFAYYGKVLSGLGLMLGGVGARMMYQRGKRTPGFFLGFAIGLLGVVIFVWGMF